MSPPNPRAADLLRHPDRLLAFGLGAGLAPRAPGTAGTVLGIPLYFALSPLGVPAYLVVTGALFLLGVWLCGRAARDLGVHDHPGIVLDEIVGYLVTMAFAPAGGWWWLWGFVVFRIFDIAKPWPIGWLDRRLHGGLGIMADDLLAGVYGAAVLWAVEAWSTLP